MSTRDPAQTLRDAGLRVTHQRQTILAVLEETGGHPDAQQIFVEAVKRDPSLSLSTVYRTLKALEDGGTIQRHSFSVEGGASRFESADRAHHDHLIDLDTGRVIEFHSEKIERLQAEIAAELGYEIVDHRLELYGRRRRGRGRGRGRSSGDEPQNDQPTGDQPAAPEPKLDV